MQFKVQGNTIKNFKILSKILKDQLERDGVEGQGNINQKMRPSKLFFSQYGL